MCPATAHALTAWILDGPHRVVGLQGVQGSGKSTLAQAAVRLLHDAGKRAVCMSLDDFYHPRDVMGMDAVRGRPGTHDVAHLRECLRGLVEGEAVALPTYDKTRWGGKGDRGPPRRVVRDVDHVIVEGWCLGFRSVPHPPPGMEAVDRALREDFEPLYAALDAMAVLDAPAHMAYVWREEAERRQRAAGRPAMSVAQVEAFVDHYMPVYHTYAQTVWETSLPLLRLVP